MRPSVGVSSRALVLSATASLLTLATCSSEPGPQPSSSTAGTIGTPDSGAAGSNAAGNCATSPTAGSMTAQSGNDTGGVAGTASGSDAGGSGGTGGVPEPPLGSWPP